MLATLLAMALAGAPGDGIRLASAGFQGAGLDQKKSDFLSDYLSQLLSMQGGIRVTGQQEVASLLGLERQRQLLGCSDQSTSCVAEIAGALGVEGMVLGSVAKLGGRFAVNVKVVGVSDGRPLSVATATLNEEDELLDWLRLAAKKIGQDVKAQLRPDLKLDEPATVLTSTNPYRLRRTAWLPAAAGVALLAGGGASYAMMKATQASFENNAPELVSPAARAGAVSNGQSLQTASFVLGAAGVAALGIATGMYFWPSSQTSMAMTVHPGGAMAVLTGELP